MQKTLASLPGCLFACGVCHYRNLSYAEQLSKKNAWASLQLEQWKTVLSLIQAAPDGEQTHYREKSWLRAFFQDPLQLSFGMFRARKRLSESGKAKWAQEFISWDQCPIHHPGITVTLENLRAEILKSATHDFLSNSLVGIWVGLPDWVIVCQKDESEYLKSLPWSTLCSTSPIDRVFAHENSQAGKKTWGHLPIIPIYDRNLKNTNRPPPGVFRQVAQTLLTEARSMAIHFLTEEQPELVLDLYCGTGEIAQELPPDISWLGIEQSKKAIQYFHSLWSDQKHYNAFVGSIEARLNDPKVTALIPKNYNIYINPPRSGISIEGMKMIQDLIQKKRPKKIAYLSCSASSLKRDLNAFQTMGFHPIHLQPYDFFPQTEHFETLALLA